MVRTPSPKSQSHPDWHPAFLVMLPAIRRHARVSFRYHDPEAREELIQEVLCNAVQAYARLAKRRKTHLAHAGSLARYSVAQVRDNRRVGGRLNIRDAMSLHCQKHKAVTVESLDKFDAVEGQWREILVEDRRAGPADTARIRLDFASWLRSLPAKARRIAKRLALGERTGEVAEKFDLSPSRISQLRAELANSWQQFVGDDPAPAAA